MPTLPPFRYTNTLANEIELKWQARWDELGTYEAPNPTGELSSGFSEVQGRKKAFVMDMFPYPSGSGLHVGHPLGYIGTDVYARALRMEGYNVLHTMGYDAFGLPAEQYAVQTNQHPRTSTNANIATMKRQLHRLGLGHDPRRAISTIDPQYYRWTQWIFLQLFNAWYDTDHQKARHIDELHAELSAGTREPRTEGAPFASRTKAEQREELSRWRLAYAAEAPVNWCPALGTVLANEEVTNEGRSERGNHPVYRRPMRQWMMRITEYADRLLEDLDLLDWSDAIKEMQRNWIGRSTGGNVDFAVHDSESTITVFTTRPDTLFGATYMVLAPEHPLVSSLLATTWPEHTPDSWKNASQSPREAVESYQQFASHKSEIDRQMDAKDKTGVFTGSYAINPTNGQRIPIFLADYVLMGYGTGAIMAVPAHDERDFAFARKFGLPIQAVVQPSDEWFAEHNVSPDAPAHDWSESYVGDGLAINSANNECSLNGLTVAEAKHTVLNWLESQGKAEPTVTYKLRDWLFSRQRYWGEPFPIVWDENDQPLALSEDQLPVELPEVDDYAPKIVGNDDELPEPPLGRAEEWKHVTLDLGDGPKTYRRELNTMPQWAGSCWYYLRYIDPTNTERLADPANERYWMLGPEGNETEPGGVDLYVGGVEHAVLHLLYARFWHKVLFDLGQVSTAEPFHRLFNQGYVLADAFLDERGIHVDAFSIEDQDGQPYFQGKPVTRQTGKMGKSLKNAVNPDDIYESYGADSLRLYEMSMGPLDMDRPWTTTGIVGLYRFLGRLWRNLIDEETGKTTVTTDSPDPETTRHLHRTIQGVRQDYANLRLNTAIAKLIELNNHLTKLESINRDVAETLVLLLAPLAPHIAEELWERLGHSTSLVWHDFPQANESLLSEDTITIPVQVQGKVRGKLTVAASTPTEELERLALALPNVQSHLGGSTPRKVIVAPGRMVSVVL